jgi:hypothetical protein
LCLARLIIQTLIAMMDSIQQHRNALKSRVVLGRPQVLMSSQYRCGASRLDRSHMIHEVPIQEGSGEMQHVPADMDCGATSIFMAPRLQKLLGLVEEAAYVMTLCPNGQVMASTSESRKTAFTVQYMEHLAPVEQLEVLVLPMRAYDLVLGLPWFQSRNPDVDWQRGGLLAL